MADDDTIRGLDDDPDDDGAGDGTQPGDAEQQGHACPECGEAFATPALLGAHRYRAHGVKGTSKRTGRRRRQTSGADASPRRPEQEPASRSRRARAVEETLTEIVATVEAVRGERTEALDLAGTVRKDAPKMGRATAALAEKIAPLAFFVDNFLGPAGPLMLARAFLPTARQLFYRWRAAMAARAQQRQEELASLVGPFGEPPGFITADGQPVYVNPADGLHYWHDGSPVVEQVQP